MAVNARWRRDPFTDDMNSILIEEEEHVIEYIQEINKYGFYAHEGIVLDGDHPVILVQDNTAQTVFTEQPKTVAPNSGQFRVDYDAEDCYNTGFVQCNAADNGKAVLFTYRGTGTIVHPTFRLQTQFNLPGNLNVEGTSNFEGQLTANDVALGVGTGATISASDKRVEDVANPTAATDAVNRQTALSLLAANTGFELLTSSGTWVCPENVTQVIYGALAGGGGGAAANGSGQGGPGGGSGGAVFGVQTVTPGASYAYTIGAGGAAGVVGVSSGSAANGGSTSIFSRTATGGGGGVGGGGAGGTVGDGDIAGSLGGAPSGNNPGTGAGAPGALGGTGTAGATSSNSAGGRGGGLLGGRGGRTGDGVAVGAGGAGANYGSGGGGGVYDGISTSYAGGAGAPGCILLMY